MSVIILNRMYVGRYLEENIGHEVINLFKADNGGNYIYINHDGKINPEYDNDVKAVLLVKYVEKGVMEVIAKAEELEQIAINRKNPQLENDEQRRYIDEHKITYGGVPLYKIYKQDEYFISVTLKVGKLLKVKEPLYLVEDESKKTVYQNHCFLPDKHFSSQSLKMYYPQDAFKTDYEAMAEMINNDSLWESENTTSKIDVNEIQSFNQNKNFLSVIRKENDELVFSNMLGYFYEQNRPVFVDFAKKVLNIPSISTDFDVYREKGDIDLWIEDGHSIIVIENKIKSKINGEKHDTNSETIQSQLSKYYEYATKNSNGKNVYAFLFTPNYNHIDLKYYDCGSKYSIVNYSDIYSYYFNHAGEMLHVNYFTEFIDGLHLHSNAIDTSNFEIMKSRFITQIKRIREQEK